MHIELTVISNIDRIENGLGFADTQKMVFSEDIIMMMKRVEPNHTELWLVGDKHVIVHESYDRIKSVLSNLHREV
jgi:hypothetical protein